MSQRQCCLALGCLGLAVMAGIAPAGAWQGPSVTITADNPPSPPPPPRETRITIDFTPGSARLSNIAKARLDEAGLQMKQDPYLHCKSIGYAGQAETDGQRLAERRGQAPKDYLVTRHGIDPARIVTAGDGSPAQGRRAVIILAEQ